MTMTRAFAVVGISLIGMSAACTNENADDSTTAPAPPQTSTDQQRAPGAPGMGMVRAADQLTPSTDDLDQRFSMLIVTKAEDGSISTEERAITLRQELEERDWDELKAQALEKGIVLQDTRAVVDPGCAAHELQVWDQTGYTGNTICIKGADVIDLGTLVRGSGSCTNHWWGYSYFGFAGSCNRSVNTGNYVRSLKSLKSGSFTPAFKDCSACLTWAAGANLTSVTPGNCEYAWNGPPTITPTCP